MDKITKYGLYDYKQFSFEDLIKKYDIGIDSDVMVKEFERLLPDIDKMGWWTEGKQGHQAQFAIQSRKDSDNRTKRIKPILLCIKDLSILLKSQKTSLEIS